MASKWSIFMTYGKTFYWFFSNKWVLKVTRRERGMAYEEKWQWEMEQSFWEGAGRHMGKGEAVRSHQGRECRACAQWCGNCMAQERYQNALVQPMMVKRRRTVKIQDAFPERARSVCPTEQKRQRAGKTQLPGQEPESPVDVLAGDWRQRWLWCFVSK